MIYPLREVIFQGPPNGLKMGRNNYRSLEGTGIKLEMRYNFTRILERNQDVHKCWFKIFMENVFHNYPLPLDLSKGIPCGVPSDLSGTLSAKR